VFESKHFDGSPEAREEAVERLLAAARVLLLAGRRDLIGLIA
jgi:hypothetical protein